MLGMRISGLLPAAAAAAMGAISLAGDLAGTGSAALTPRVGSITGLAGVVSVRSGSALSFDGGATVAAAAGLTRYPNAETIVAYRNAANNADVVALTSTSADQTQVNGTTLALQSAGVSRVTIDTSTVTTTLPIVLLGTPATAGDIRGANNRNLLVARNAANTANVVAVIVTGADIVSIGDGTNGAGVSIAARSPGGNLDLVFNTVVIQDGATLAAALTIVPLSSGVTRFDFAASLTGVTIRQLISAGDGVATTVQAQSAAAGAFNGGFLNLQGGARGQAANVRGGVRLQFNATSETGVGVEEVVSGQRVVSLCRLANLTSTQMPANTGDGVVYLANATTNPSANSVSGGILYSTAGALTWRGTNGTVTTIAAA